MPSPILCLGAINVDLKFQVDDLEGFLKDWGTGLSRAGEEPVSREDEARLTSLLARYGRPAGRYGGGMAANTAYALACLGLPVALVGRVGNDADGEFLQETLTGVDLSHVVAQGESGRAYILTDAEGERTILVAPNTNDDLKEGDLPWETLAAADLSPSHRLCGRTALWRCSALLPAGSRIASGSAWTRGNGTPAGAGWPWKISWTTWRPCWSRKPSGGNWGESPRFTPTGPRPWC